MDSDFAHNSKSKREDRYSLYHDKIEFEKTPSEALYVTFKV